MYPGKNDTSELCQHVSLQHSPSLVSYPVLYSSILNIKSATQNEATTFGGNSYDL